MNIVDYLRRDRDEALRESRLWHAVAVAVAYQLGAGRTADAARASITSIRAYCEEQGADVSRYDRALELLGHAERSAR